MHGTIAERQAKLGTILLSRMWIKLLPFIEMNKKVKFMYAQHTPTSTLLQCKQLQCSVDASMNNA